MPRRTMASVAVPALPTAAPNGYLMPSGRSKAPKASDSR
jgi:hypothetical protein